jgi:hypothetical protein
VSGVKAMLAAALAGLTLVSIPAAQADGDPASDVLYFQDVFLPFTSPAKTVGDKLVRATATARARKHPIKVAVIWQSTDMGSVPLLFNKPGIYARFLGIELGDILTGPLVVVMPAGFGLYQRSGSPTAAKRLLASAPFHAKTVEQLTATAAAGVRKLTSALAPVRGDVRPPTARALATTGRLGTKGQLPFRISDNSGRARALVRVDGAQYALFATLSMPLKHVRAHGSLQHVPWRIPVTIGAGKFKFCVLALDKNGNSSLTSCAALTITS